MVKKGTITSVDTVSRKARVTFPNLDNTVTAEIPYAEHVGPEINDTAIVAIFSGTLVDALIIAVRREV